MSRTESPIEGVEVIHNGDNVQVVFKGGVDDECAPDEIVQGVAQRFALIQHMKDKRQEKDAIIAQLTEENERLRMQNEEIRRLFIAFDEQLSQ